MSLKEDGNTFYGKALVLDTPYEKWNESAVLFSSNDSVKGKVYFKIKTIEFKLKHKSCKPRVWNLNRNITRISLQPGLQSPFLNWGTISKLLINQGLYSVTLTLLLVMSVQ